MANTLVNTDFNFEGQKSVYHGKVRDVYDINDDILVMVATDRISAFDVILPKGIPFKGQVLNQIAAKFLDATADIVPNWKLATPDPMVTVGLKCEGFRVEMIIRGYLTGSAWREYAAGCRELCGVKLPKGVMLSNDGFNAIAFDFRHCGVSYKRGQRFLNIIPMFSSYGIVSSLHMPLTLGLEVVVIPKFNADKVGYYVKKYRPEHTLLVPAH